MKEENGKWITTKNGSHVFIKEGESKNDAINRKFGESKIEKTYGKAYDKLIGEAQEEYRKSTSTDENAKEKNKKLTPAEKIASVHIDFDRDNVLPELNENALKQMGVKTSKKVLLKKSIIEKNRRDHDDITDKDMENIIAHALYDEESDIFRANPNNPNYYHFASFYDFERNGQRHKGVALLDIDDKKENFEIVHAHLMRERSLKTAKKK